MKEETSINRFSFLFVSCGCPTHTIGWELSREGLYFFSMQKLRNGRLCNFFPCKNYTFWWFVIFSVQKLYNGSLPFWIMDVSLCWDWTTLNYGIVVFILFFLYFCAFPLCVSNKCGIRVRLEPNKWFRSYFRTASTPNNQHCHH